MNHTRSLAQLETDLVALRAAAERAGMALACLFSTSDEFHAAVIQARRAAGAFTPRRRYRALHWAALAALALAFLML